MSGMADILLIQPPIRDFYLTAKRTIPYGLASVGAVLMREGFSVEILDCLATRKSKPIDLPVEMEYLKAWYGKPDISPFGLFHRYRHYGLSFGKIAEAVRRAKPFLVGISSLFTAYCGEALRTAETVRDAAPGCTIVMGGHHPTELYESVMECGAVDFVLRGEGEASLSLLARALRAGSGIENVPGIVYRAAEGGLRAADPAVMEDLDRYPLPAQGLIDGKFYRRGARGAAVVTASRGCPLGCSYCSIGGAEWLKYRRRSVDSVLREIAVAVNEYGAGFIDFEDENLSLRKAWFMELLDGIAGRFGAGRLELRAMNGLFPPSLDEEMVSAMKEAGFTALNLSLGSACPEQARRFGRPDVREGFDRALAWAERVGLNAVGYVIVGAPGQSAADSMDDLLYLAERPVVAGVSVYYPAPGSADFARCARSGLLPGKFSLMRSTALPVSDTTTRDESATLLRLGRILNFMKLLEEAGRAVAAGNREERCEVGARAGRGRTGESFRAQADRCSAGAAADVMAERSRGAMSAQANPCVNGSDLEEREDRRGAGATARSAREASRSEAAAVGALPAEPVDRIEVGKRLLRVFLAEGKIFGMTPAGEVYEHRVSKRLCDRFLAGLSRIGAGRVSLDRPKNRMV